MRITSSQIERSQPPTNTESSVPVQQTGTEPNSVIGMTVKNAQPTISAGVAIKTVVGESRHLESDSHRATASKEFTILTSSASLTLNYLMAHRAKDHVRSMLRRGSNAAFDAKIPQNDAKNLIEKLRDEKRRRLLMRADAKTIPSRRGFDTIGRPLLITSRADMAQVESDLLQESGYGHCAEQAAAAYCYLLKKPHDGLVEICTASGTRHTLVVMGRRADSDPNDMRT
jgi:hypothetical protein